MGCITGTSGMIASSFLAIVYGFASAASWGAGDFSGGMASKRTHVYYVVLISQLTGAILLLGLALLMREPFPMPIDLVYGAGAGISGVIGLLALYRGLALGQMAIVAPIAAVVSAAIPVLVGLFIEGLPGTRQWIGFSIALIGVWLISQTREAVTLQVRDVGLASLAGVGFGLFFVVIDRVSDGAVLWPLIAARAAPVSMLLVFVAVLMRQTPMPVRQHLPLIALSGIFDTGGNAFFVLSTQTGRLDIAAVLSSLYPVSTIMLAWFFLHERLLPQQWGGVIAALTAVVLLAS
ncbi:MAG: DMT family transporter [bacterium]|nr:DMT family transporter [bacterium]